MDKCGVVAIIPARGGSHRLPGKNIKLLAGKPLIAWTIEAALNSRVLDGIVVSSDDEDILNEARKYPVKVLKRPDYLATSSATTFDTLLHCLDLLPSQEIAVDQIMLLQPTSPLRTAEDIDRALALKKESGACSVISVCECEHSPLWTNVLNEKGDMEEFIPSQLLNKRSQDLPVYYRLNGAIYVADVDEFRKYRGFFMPNSRAYVMPAECSVDIDTEMDFKLSQLLLEKNE
ncbi:acylneuraminate cytidylyltransferase family protein [uncultured Marinobacter sp.]|uniref:acylneuraminate cytidylyltransferase family protein n=1 Tax=uncultured Marinobacter sp. TaxID=187379 RepID=UPI0030DA4CDF|tara:strand:+ start:650 stop:1345 length:696 start_codon:yes stop_codon:yes gene_type:complete